MADLLRPGVPKNLLTQVKQLNNEGELDQVKEHLPEKAYEGLFYLLAGDSHEEVYSLTPYKIEENVDIEGFEKTLDKENSKYRFYIVDENDIDLMSMLAPLEGWRVFLHPTQGRLVYRYWNGAIRLFGGAGTGKTVATMHRAKWLKVLHYLQYLCFNNSLYISNYCKK